MDFDDYSGFRITEVLFWPKTPHPDIPTTKNSEFQLLAFILQAIIAISRFLDYRGFPGPSAKPVFIFGFCMIKYITLYDTNHFFRLYVNDNFTLTFTRMGLRIC